MFNISLSITVFIDVLVHYKNIPSSAKINGFVFKSKQLKENDFKFYNWTNVVTLYSIQISLYSTL